MERFRLPVHGYPRPDRPASSEGYADRSSSLMTESCSRCVRSLELLPAPYSEIDAYFTAGVKPAKSTEIEDAQPARRTSAPR